MPEELRRYHARLIEEGGVRLTYKTVWARNASDAFDRIMHAPPFEVLEADIIETTPALKENAMKELPKPSIEDVFGGAEDKLSTFNITIARKGKFVAWNDTANSGVEEFPNEKDAKLFFANGCREELDQLVSEDE